MYNKPPNQTCVLYFSRLLTKQFTNVITKHFHSIKTSYHGSFRIYALNMHL